MPVRRPILRANMCARHWCRSNNKHNFFKPSRPAFAPTRIFSIRMAIPDNFMCLLVRMSQATGSIPICPSPNPIFNLHNRLVAFVVCTRWSLRAVDEVRRTTTKRLPMFLEVLLSARFRMDRWSILRLLRNMTLCRIRMGKGELRFRMALRSQGPQTLVLYHKYNGG